MEEYKKCISAVQSFYNSLEDTDIKFLFFYAKKSTFPAIKTRFKKYIKNEHVYYLVQGKDHNYTMNPI